MIRSLLISAGEKNKACSRLGVLLEGKGDVV